MAKGGHGGKAQGSPAMREAWRLFDKGDVRAARRAARETLASSGADEATRQEAGDLLRRTGFPTDALKVAAIAGTLIVVLILIAVIRG